MRVCKLAVWCSLGLLSAAAQAVAQGAFQNLDFDAAGLIPIPGDPYGSVEYAAAFPGWTAYVGQASPSSALCNNYFLDTAGIGIIDHDWPAIFGGAGLIEGTYTALLQAGYTGALQPTDVSLLQVGLVPTGTESLLFKACFVRGGLTGTFTVSLGGQELSLVPLASTSKWVLYGADIHQWAGQTATLSFTVEAQRPHIGDNNLYLDSIEFSPQTIPEPSVGGLGILGGLIFAGAVLRNRKPAARR